MDISLLSMSEYYNFQFDEMCKAHDKNLEDYETQLDSIPIKEIEKYLRKKKLESIRNDSR